MLALGVDVGDSLYVQLAGHCATLKTYADRESWLEARLAGIGSSEAAAVLGQSPWKSRYTLWAEKTGLVERASAGSALSAPARWGLKLEAIVAEEFREVTGRQLFDNGTYTIARSRECPFMCATHDRLILPIDDGRGMGVLSVKTADKVKTEKWNEGVPIDYQIQLQHELAVSGAKWGAFAVLIGGNDFRVVMAERDEQFIDMLKEELFLFWGAVERKEQPPVDASESTAETLRRIYPRDSGETIELPGEALAWDERLQSVRSQMRELEQERQALENKFIAALGANAFGTIKQAGARYSYKTIERKACTVDAVTFRRLVRLKMRTDEGAQAGRSA